MSQYDFSTINAATKSGTQLAVDLNNWRDAVHTNHSGNARPSYVQAGMIWIDTTSSTLWLIKLYDGADDIVLFQVDTSNNIARVRSRRQEVVKTADYTLTADDSYVAIIMNKTGTGTLALPALSGTASELYFTENISSSAVTVDPNSSETINGQTTLSLSQYGCAYIWPATDKSTWRCMTSSDVAAAIHAATGKTTLVDNDELGAADSAASYALKKVLFSNLLASIFTTSRKHANAQFLSGSFALFDTTDQTKKLAFDLTPIGTGVTRTFKPWNVGAYASLQDQKTTGTSGGTTTTGWQTRTLNTEVTDPDNIVSISSNTFTTTIDCVCDFSTVAYGNGNSLARLYNVTDSVVVAYSENGNAVAATSGTIVQLRGKCKVVAGKTYRLEMYSQTAQANGLGPASSATSAVEVYSSIFLQGLAA